MDFALVFIFVVVLFFATVITIDTVYGYRKLQLKRKNRELGKFRYKHFPVKVNQN